MGESDRRDGRHVRWWATAGVLGALLLVMLVAGVGAPSAEDPPGPPPPAEPGGPEDAAAFLAAWEQSRTSTYRVEAVTTRVAPDGRSLGEELTIIQRPPDRLTVRGSQVDGLLGGLTAACTRPPGGDASCRLVDRGESFDDAVDEQYETLETYVQGTPPLYGVARTDDGECYELSLLIDVPAPPLGTFARYCFDPATSAPTETRVEHPEAVIATTAESVTGEVTDADLELPAPLVD